MILQNSGFEFNWLVFQVQNVQTNLQYTILNDKVFFLHKSPKIMHLPNYKIRVYNTIIQDSITDSEPTEAEPIRSCVCMCILYASYRILHNSVA